MASIKRSDLKLGKELGSGGFGTVFRGIWKTENKVVAVKKLNKVDFQEIDMLRQLQHPNIVILYGFVHEETDLMIVMELCEIGSLGSFLKQHVANPLPPSLIHDWMLQAALPIDHLRNQNIEHMDIKTDNYVITSRMVLKLTDFGLSQTLEKTRSYSSGAGSWRWMPPERLRDLKLSPKFSIYALALVFWCLFTRALPYSKYPSEFSIAKAVCDEKVRPPMPSTCPKPIWELIEACWHDERSRRPDIRDVIIALILHKAAFDSGVKHVGTQSTSPVLKTSVTQTKIGKYSDASTQTVSESCTTKDGTPLPSVREQSADGEMQVEGSLYVVPNISSGRSCTSYGFSGSSKHSNFLDTSVPAISYTTHRGPSQESASKAAAFTSPPSRSTTRGVSNPSAKSKSKSRTPLPSVREQSADGEMQVEGSLYVVPNISSGRSCTSYGFSGSSKHSNFLDTSVPAISYTTHRGPSQESASKAAAFTSPPSRSTTRGVSNPSGEFHKYADVSSNHAQGRKPTESMPSMQSTSDNQRYRISKPGTKSSGKTSPHSDTLHHDEVVSGASSPNEPVQGSYFVLLFDKEVEIKGGGTQSLIQPQPKHQKLLRGSLLEHVSPVEQWQEPGRRHCGNGRYMKLRRVQIGQDTPSVADVDCYFSEVARVTKDEMELLSAISSDNERYRAHFEPQLLRRALALKENMHVKVEVKCDTMKSILPGIIRYIGQLPNECGRQFGIELHENPGQGSSDGVYRKQRFFTCAKDSAVFVSVNKLKFDKTAPVASRGAESQSLGAGINPAARQSVIESDLKQDMEVYVSTKKGSREEYVKGKIIYIGKPFGEKGTYVGVELEKPRIQPWDGTFKSRRLCKPKSPWYSELVPINDIVPVELLEGEVHVAASPPSSAVVKSKVPGRIVPLKRTPSVTVSNKSHMKAGGAKKNSNDSQSIGSSFLHSLTGSNDGTNSQKGFRKFSKEFMSKLQSLGSNKEGSTLQAELPPLGPELIEEICLKVDHNWAFLADYLEVDKNKIQKISGKTTNSADRVIFTMVHWWKKVHKQPQAIQTLAYALSELKLEKLAGRVLIAVAECEMDNELLDIVAARSYSNWKSLADELGLENETIEEIDKGGQTYHASARRMLDVWDKEINIGCEKLTLLVRACRHSGNTELANELEQGLDAETLERISRMVDETRWYKFGQALGFPDDYLSAMANSNDIVKLRVYMMLGMWINTQPFSVDKILAISSALEHCGLQKLAWEICRGLDDDILNHLAFKLQKDWRRIGTLLNLPNSEMNKLATGFTDDAKRAHQVLTMWRRRQHASCDLLGELAKVLRDTEYREISDWLVHGIHDNVLDKVASLIAVEWEDLANNLGFEKADIEAIKDGNKVKGQQIYKMLCQWRYRQHYNTDRVQVLTEGLEKCGLHDVADVVLQFTGRKEAASDSSPRGVLNSDQLMTISKELGTRWQLIAGDLNVDRKDIFQLSETNLSPEDKCHRMFLIWQASLPAGNDGKSDLIQALDSCGRHDLVVSVIGPRADFGGFKSPTLKGYIHPPRTLSPEFVGRKKGIQGYQNSTYIDTTLFSMYAYSNIFDDILHRKKSTKDLQEYETIQTMLREDIVNPLRSYGFVRADRVLKLREYLDQLGTTKGFRSEEKDSEEFLHTFLQEVTKTEPFLHIRQQGGRRVEKSYHYQIFMEKNESYQLPSVEQLLHYSFLHSDLQLAKVPPCLIMQMPRIGKDRMYNRILPSLYLDISDLLEGWPRICSVCGKVAEVECRDCSGKLAVTGIVEAINSYCQDCSNTIHVHSHRKNHKVKEVQLSDEFFVRYAQAKENGMMEQEIHEKVIAPRKLMELFAVVCVQTSHYTAFVKAGSGAGSQWVFFDSMADREGDKQGYNIPEITHLREFQSWLENQTALKETNDKDLPPPLRRLLCDGYMCMYQDPDVVKQHQKQFQQTTPVDSIVEPLPPLPNVREHSDSLDMPTPAISYTTHRGPSQGRTSKAALNAVLCYRKYADALTSPPPGSTPKGFSDPAAEYRRYAEVGSLASGSKQHVFSPPAYKPTHHQHQPTTYRNRGSSLDDELASNSSRQHMGQIGHDDDSLRHGRDTSSIHSPDSQYTSLPSEISRECKVPLSNDADVFSRPSKEPSVIVNQQHYIYPPSQNDFSNVTDVVADAPVPRTHPARVQVGTSQSQPRYDLYSSSSSSRYQTNSDSASRLAKHGIKQPPKEDELDNVVAGFSLQGGGTAI